MGIFSKLWARICPSQPLVCIYHYVRIPIYGHHLHILVQNDYQQTWDKLFPDAGWKPGKKASGSACFDYVRGVAYIVVGEDATAGTVAHEAAHIAHFVMQHIGAKLDPDNDEPLCYLQSWIVDEIEKARKILPAIHSPLSV